MSRLSYCDDLLHYQRRVSREVMVGNVGVGGANPIRVQSMITCDTMDTEASIAQSLELAQVGCEIVRITAPTVKDAANLQHIVRGLRERGCDVPIVADIHFKPEAAMEAAKWVEKVRINPGNYADSKKFKIIEYSDEQYAAELERIRERFTPLVRLSLERGIAMRIGTNHGSLSDRIMNRYGDTPLGMVESALEFARIARDLDYHALIFSMKSSNPKVMIAAYRLLVARLREEGADWNYPIHLGVTEAGEGEDARIKSAIGIGSLLRDGIGDTIRVSLTEDSIHEIPVARALVETTQAAARSGHAALETPATGLSFDPFSYQRRETAPIAVGDVRLGGEETVRVAIRQANFEKVAHKVDRMGDYKPEFVYEKSGVVEVDPRDDASIASLNHGTDAKMVAVADGLDLPVIAAYRLLAAKAGSPASDSAEGSPNAFRRPRRRIPPHAPDRGDQHRLPSLRRHRRRHFSPRRTRAGSGIAPLLQHPPGGRDPDFQDRLCRLPFLRPDAFQPPDHDREDQSRHHPPQGGQDRDHGLHREWAGGNGGCGFRLRRRCAGQGEPLRRQNGGKIQHPRGRSGRSIAGPDPRTRQMGGAGGRSASGTGRRGRSGSLGSASFRQL